MLRRFAFRVSFMGVAMFLAAPLVVYGQEATISGTVTDTTGGVLPGVTVAAMHRVDVRLQERVPLGRGVTIDGVLEVFNLFNHDNFGSYTTSESSPRYGQPNVNLNVAYVPRTLQLGFRLAF